MPTPKRGPRLGGNAAHQKHLLANLASDLYRHGRITTTEARAKALRPYAEKLITKAKRGDLAARRQALSRLHDRDVVAYLFEEVGPRFADRDGGYTRILKLGPRRGDNAPMAMIELVDRGVASGDEVIEDSKAGRSRGLFGRRRRRAETAAPEEGAPAFDVEDDQQVAAAIAEATGTEARPEPAGAGEGDADAASDETGDAAVTDDTEDADDTADPDETAEAAADDDEDEGRGA